MKDALTYRVAIEIQDIIFKTQTVRSGISACTRLRLSLRRLTHVAVRGSIFANSSFVKLMHAFIISLYGSNPFVSLACIEGD